MGPLNCNVTVITQSSSVSGVGFSTHFWKNRQPNLWRTFFICSRVLHKVTYSSMLYQLKFHWTRIQFAQFNYSYMESSKGQVCPVPAPRRREVLLYTGYLLFPFTLNFMSSWYDFLDGQVQSTARYYDRSVLLMIFELLELRTGIFVGWSVSLS